MSTMGCGSSKPSVVSHNSDAVKHRNEQDKAAICSVEDAPSCKIEQKSPVYLSDDAVSGDHALPLLNRSDEGDMPTNAHQESPFNVKGSVGSLQQTESRSSIGEDGYSTADNPQMENKLATETVIDTLQAVKNSVASLAGEENIAHACKSAKMSVDEKDPSLPPSTTAISKDSPTKEEDFNRYLKQASKLSTGEKLIEAAAHVNTLKLNRSFYTFTKSDALFKVVSAMQHLYTLNLSGSQVGPVAFRFIVISLRSNASIKRLDLSDNLANPECSAALGSLVAANSALELVNVSGNRLGKDALSRYLGAALKENNTLKSLDVSNIGATDLHCLCESLRYSSVTTLLAADNSIEDDQQFAVDISLNLGSDNCILEEIDISNSSIGSDAMSMLIDAIAINSSIRSLKIGKNSTANFETLCAMISNACAHPNMALCSVGKTKVDDTTVRDFVIEREFKNSQMKHLDISDCSLDDEVLKMFVTQINGKLPHLEYLDLSKNDIGPYGLEIFDDLSNTCIRKLKLTNLSKTDGIIDVLTSKFPNLTHIDITRTKFSNDDIKKVAAHATLKVCSFTYGGMNLNGVGAMSAINDLASPLSLTELYLSVCQLDDDDMTPLCNVLANSLPLEKIDVSVNRLTAKFISNLVEALLKHSTHCLKSVDASNNTIDGASLGSLTKLFTSATHSSSVTHINLSRNGITAGYVTDFVSALKNHEFPLEHLDLSNQNDGFVEADMEDLAKVIKDILLSPSCKWQRSNFVIDLRRNGGSEIPDFNLLDSAAIKTDFEMNRRSEPTLKDLIEIRHGLELQSHENSNQTYSISADEWREIIQKDAPAWAFVTSELSQAAFLSHMPSSVTSQRIEGMLETDADCEIKDIFLIKDPIMQQSTGSAWVLFENAQSLTQAVDWFYNGCAHIFGGQFSVSEIPLKVSDESHDAAVAAKRDLTARNLEAVKQLEIDRKMLEDSNRLATERAEYRELHPAYQGGRIS